MSTKISKLVPVVLLALGMILMTAAPAFAQGTKDTTPAAQRTFPENPTFSGAGLAGGLGMGLTIIGAGLGLGKIGAAALEGMSRQPEAAPNIQTAMIIIAAMLEGATLASVVLCFLVGNKSTF